ncbi:MAG: HAMP domain-containing histidine kinase [Polyangiaceae bacterium]|nr:HAMP domain-containing histidine kinase [Polyangiaceae bacterium]
MEHDSTFDESSGSGEEYSADSRQYAALTELASAVPLRKTAWRIVIWEFIYTLAVGVALVGPLPKLLLLPPEMAEATTGRFLPALLLAFMISATQALWLLERRRPLLEQLHNQEAAAKLRLARLNDDPWVIVNSWALCTGIATNLGILGLRPDALGQAEALRVALFATIIIAALALPLLMAIRKQFVKIVEQVPPTIMAKLIEYQVRGRKLRGRTSRRLLAAIVTPVVFLSIGGSLIAATHLQNISTRLALDMGQRISPLGIAFEPTQPVFWPIFPITLLTALCAAWAGIALGGRLSQDLRMADRGVRMLGTDAALDGTRVMRPARFRAVAELGASIEELSDRFRLFAQTQERSIAARAAATHARGRFFASVSHDLKSPLNAILGFSELTRQQPNLLAPQRESLSLILARGRELLVLVETILDAARVEARQLHLELDHQRIEDILEAATAKGRDLTNDSNSLILLDLHEHLPLIAADSLRLAQALATLIAFARRRSIRGSIRVLATAEEPLSSPGLQKRTVSIHIEIPSSKITALELEALLAPDLHPGQHRGEALALRLAQAIIELHGGRLRITGHTVREPAFAIDLQGIAGG